MTATTSHTGSTSHTASATDAASADPAVLADLKRTLQPAGLRFAEGRQVEQGELAPVLAELARRQRRLGKLLCVLGSLMVVMGTISALAFALRTDPDAGAASDFLGFGPRWASQLVHVLVGASQLWLGWRCLRWSRALQATGARCAAGTLDAAGALGAIDAALGGRLPPSRF